jgi:hypothetical protein
MRHFNLLLGQEIRGPLSEAEIKQLIASGEVTAEARCALVGAQAWEPLSRHFTLGPSLKVRWTKPVSTEAEERLAAVRIDPETRRRLIAYGLADAVTMEGLTQAQARQAIALKETGLRDERSRHRLAFMIALMLGLSLGTATGLAENAVSGQLGRLVSFFIQEKGNAKDALHMLRGSLHEEADIRERERASKLPVRKPAVK